VIIYTYIYNIKLYYIYIYIYTRHIYRDAHNCEKMKRRRRNNLINIDYTQYNIDNVIYYNILYERRTCLIYLMSTYILESQTAEPFSIDSILNIIIVNYFSIYYTII
jgi:hypothetical protein